MPIKVIWDYTYYWSVLAQMFFQQRMGDLQALAALRDELAQAQRLNEAVQGFLRAWGEVSARRNPAVMLDQAAMPWFAELNRSLTDTLDDAAYRQRLCEATARLATLAQQIADRALAEHPQLDAAALHAAIAAAGGARPGFGELLHPVPREVRLAA
jgi:hypothetical protein